MHTVGLYLLLNSWFNFSHVMNGLYNYFRLLFNFSRLAGYVKVNFWNCLRVIFTSRMPLVSFSQQC